MRKLLSIAFVFATFSVLAQRQIPIAASFRDAVFQNGFEGPAIFPLSERESDFFKQNRDTTKRYSMVGVYFYKRELIERKDALTGSRLWITPILDVMLGAQKDGSISRVSQNTRGARMEGQLGKKLFFTTSFYENQAFLPSYASSYAQSRGEQYYHASDSTYETANAVISGAARTKPFKTGGFDYAYAIGNISWYVTKKISLLFGNQPQFIGSGYRSMLWSDNSGGFMNLRAQWKLSSKWNFQFMRGRMLNLVRRPYTTNSEAWYQKKSVSWTTVSYMPAKWLTFTLFEGGMWSRGDSIHQRSTDALFYVPLPGTASTQALTSASAFAISGLDFSMRLYNQVLYGQFALSPGASSSSVYQLGARLHPFKMQRVSVQVEYNHADVNAYNSPDPNISWSGMNLPIAHPAGNGLDELLMRISGEYRHIFANLAVNYFFHENADSRSLMPVYSSTPYASQSIVNSQVQAGYRFNRTIGFEVYGIIQYRSDFTHKDQVLWGGIGLRTSLNNHYFDF